MPGRIGSWVNSSLNRPLYALMAAALDLGTDDELVDIACGSGVFLAEYASEAGHVAGIDLSEPKVGLARQRLRDRIAAGTAEVVTGDAGALPFPDDRFSAVTSMDAWGFVLYPDPAPVLSEMHRVLRPGGRAVVQVGYRTLEDAEADTMLARVRATFRAWTDADVRGMFEGAGFTDVAVSFGRTAGDMRVFGLAARLLGFDESRLVRAVKPLPVRTAGDVRTGDAVAVT
jgi:SAM-dependent methyltransferase